MAALKDTVKEVEEFLAKSKKFVKGITIAEAGIDAKVVRVYAKIARRCRDDKQLGLTDHPYESGARMEAFDGGYFEHREWSLRKGMESHAILRGVYEYEANYIKSAGYWIYFHEVALSLRGEDIEAKEFEDAKFYVLWAAIVVRYGLRVTGLRCEFYKLTAKDPA